MALTNIQYGSLASSTVLNTNFNYLDNRISTTASGINSTISSVQSNIATINSRLTELSEDLADAISNFSTSLNDLKSNALTVVNKISMSPQWSARTTLSELSSYTVPSNGYLLLLSPASAGGDLVINNVTTVVKQVSSVYDYAKELLVIPVKKNDVVTSQVTLDNIYFVPAVIISSEEL